jgi:hypothetical protein
MFGNDKLDTLAERLFGRIAKQRVEGMVPANDRSRAVGRDNSVSDMIENPLGQFGLLFHGAARARPVFDNKRLAEPLRQPLTDQACCYISAAARGKADYDEHWPQRIDLRPSEARDARQRGGARGQVQKLPTKNFHGVLLDRHFRERQRKYIEPPSEKNAMF